MSFVYIIKVINTQYYKIGESSNPQDRIKNIQVSIPFDLELIYFKKVNQSKLVESYIQSFFIRKHIRGEWFELNIDDINDIKEFLENMDSDNISEIVSDSKKRRKKFLSAKLKRNKQKEKSNIKNHLSGARVEFKKPRIVQGKGKSKRMYVVFHVQDKITGKFKRIRVTGNINRIKNHSSKLSEAKQFRDKIEKALINGFNPFRHDMSEIENYARK